MDKDHGNSQLDDATAAQAKISEEGDASASAEAKSVQWVLQPRGTAARRGPENFEHSIRNGIRLSEYEHVLGAHAAELKRIFPDGVARLWGATPTEEARNEKVTALRDRKVGDEVLFYAEKKFIAKAKILGLLRSRQLAEAVWGVDEKNQRTWEHIMALGEIVEFQVPAEPILTALSLPFPLRSLTLVSADDRLRFRGLLEEPLGEMSQPVDSPSSRPAKTPRMGRNSVLRAMGSLSASPEEEGRVRHEALALLWMMGRLGTERNDTATWDEFEAEVSPLLRDFGRADSGAGPEYLFWHLRSSGLWEVEGIDRSDVDPTSESLRAAGAKAGFRRDVARLLLKPLVRAEAIAVLRSTYLADVDQDALLERVGLEGYDSASGTRTSESEEGDGPRGPVDRRQTTSSRPNRDPKLVEMVKTLYQHQCQACGLRLEVRFGHYSEAAHIRGLGFPHEGPDELPNLLCFCPNHHVQFDKLAIYVDQDWEVRRSADDTFVSSLHRHPEHFINEEHVRYHRGLCGKNPVDTEAE